MNPGEVLDGRFQLGEVAGTGGMSVVFKAQDLSTGETVALKVLTENRGGEAERFVREARVLGSLHHPGIVRLLADGMTRTGQPYLALEWLDGESLADRLGRAPLTVVEAVAVAAAVAEALATAHRAGVVHRDIKPGNIFLLGGSPARVKVLDFGIARLAAATVALTQTGAILGTPMYMAPEQARGERALDARADIFALGCVLFECLVGQPPFVGRHAAAVLAKILLEEAPRVATLRENVPAALDELVNTMLAKRPEARPADATAVAAALGSLTGIPETLAPRQERRRRALTEREQRFLSVVMVGGEQRLEEDEATVATSRGRPRPETLHLVRRSVLAHGGHLEVLADGSMVAVLKPTGVATDQAARAARCALALRALLPGHLMALATGRGTLTGEAPVGEVIERATRLVAEAPAGTGHTLPVWLDPVSSGLLEPSFEIEVSGSRHALRAEREAACGARTLLGKPSPCVGRDRELATLEAILAESLAEPVAHVVLLSGPAGAGKSRLRAELLQRVESRYPEVSVWLSRGDVMRAGEPFGMIAPLVRRAAGIRGEDTPDEARTRLSTLVGSEQPEPERRRIAEFLGELTGVPFAGTGSVQLEAARTNAIVMGDQMRRAFEDLLAAVCSRHGVLLVFEDLHWGDLPSVRFIDAALRNLHDRPLTVLALARPEIHDVFPHLWEERGLEEIRLAELSRRASERLVRAVLGETADEATVRALVQQAGGNPFFLEELIRAAAEGATSALPETVLAMLGARIEALPHEARRLLRAGSLLGQRFDAAALAYLLDEADPASIDEWLLELAERELLTAVRDDASEHRPFAFRHALLRDAAYATLTAADRALGHRLAAEWLEARSPVEPGALGEHWERGNEPARALPCYLKAAALALQGNDFDAVIERAARGEACGASGPVLGELRLLAAEAQHWRGEAALAESLAEQATALLPRDGARWFAAAALLATTAGRLTHHDRLEALAAELAALPAAAGHEGTAAAAHVAAAVALCHAGRLGHGSRLLDHAIATLGGPHAGPVVTAWLDRGRGMRAAYAGDTTSSLQLTESSARAFEAAGDLRTACQQWGNVGFLKRELGLCAEAEQALRVVLDTAERMGLSHIVPTTRHNLGWALALQGDLDGAIAMEEQAAAAFARQLDHRFEGTTRVYLARIHLLAGDLEAASREVDAAVARLAAVPQSQAWALGVRAELLLARGQGEAALAAARQALTLLRGIGGTDEGEAVVYLAAGRALAASGAVAEARQVVSEGVQRLLERARRITDDAWRRSFLEAIPEHAGLRALAVGLGVSPAAPSRH